ncbi:MAG: flagellar hook-length control protein FliK [Planctomycetota bacterium]|nr:MAG: flagellar hook-length control protein FliK [Planctomycetota bacterium]
MTSISSLTSPSTRTQLLPGTESFLRDSGKPGAFETLFAEKSAPEPEAENSDSKAMQEGLSPDGDEASVEHEAVDRDEDAQTTESGEGPDSQIAASGSDDAAPHPQGIPDPSPGEPAPEKAYLTEGIRKPPAKHAPVHREQIRAELVHAATVNLADLAWREMVAKPGVDGIRPPPPPVADRPQAGPGDAAGPSVSNGGNNSSAGRHEPGQLGLPTPIDAPDQPGVETTKTESQPAQPAFPNGKQPSTGDPISASNQARQVSENNGNSTQLQTSQAVGRTIYLDRLAEQAAARRGAVAAPDRVLTTGSEGRSVSARAVFEPAAAERPSQPREAFLAPVQKGLAKMLAQNGGRMTVLLRPERLGEVKIRMETSEGTVRVRMEAGTEAARRTLESGLDALRAGLESRGVRVENLEISRTPEPPAHSSADSGSAHPDGQHRENHATGPSHTFRPSADSEPDEGNLPVRIGHLSWTELGIDAVA